MTKYQEIYRNGKERIRSEALDFYDEFLVMSWAELQQMTDYFYRYGKRYGLLRELRENGVI